MRIGLVVALLMVVAVPARADAYVIAGRKWPDARISVYNASPYRYAVREAMRVWNRSGVRLRFVTSRSRRRADLVVRLGSERVGAAFGGCAGSASVGWFGGQARMRLHRGCADDQLTAGVVVHELGHVLGLGHERRRCSQMNSFFVNGVPNRCSITSDFVTDGAYRCRMLERDDLNGARRLYGGRGRVRGGNACPIFAAPRALRSLTAGLDGFGTIALQYRTRERPRRIARIEGAEDPRVELRYTRAQNTCPARTATAGTPVEWDAGGTLYTYEQLPPGTWCYVAWLVDDRGRASRSTELMVTVPPTPGTSPP